MDNGKDIRLLVLNILKEGRINVEEADKIINYINSTEKDKASMFQYPNPEAIGDFAREGVSKIEKFVSGLGFNIERVAQNITHKINNKFETTAQQNTQVGEKFTFTDNEVINLDENTDKLILENNWGSIKVSGEDRKDISLSFEKIIWTNSKELADERDKGLKIGRIQNDGVLQILLPTSNQEINDTINVDVKVPNRLLLQLSSSNGNILVESINNDQGKIGLKTGSGDIEVNNTTVAETDLNSVSGDIVLKNLYSHLLLRSTSGNIEANGELLQDSRVTTISGNIRADVIISESLEITSSSGTVDLKNAKNDNCKLIDIITNSGDISYNGIVSNTLRTRTNSGNIKGNSIVANTGIIEISGTSGDIDWGIDDDSDISFRCESKTGEIFTNLEEAVKSQGSISGKIKEGKAKLLLSTVNGDLRFYKGK